MIPSLLSLVTPGFYETWSTKVPIPEYDIAGKLCFLVGISAFCLSQMGFPKSLTIKKILVLCGAKGQIFFLWLKKTKSVLSISAPMAWNTFFNWKSQVSCHLRYSSCVVSLSPSLLILRWDCVLLLPWRVGWFQSILVNHLNMESLCPLWLSLI